MSETIKCEVVAEKVWHSTECRYLKQGEVVEFPAQVNGVPFKVGDSFKVVEEAKKGK